MLDGDLEKKLAAADRQFQREAGVSFALRVSRYLVALLLVLFTLDVVLHLASGSRALLSACYAMLVLAISGCAWYIAKMRRNRLEHVARLLESRDASLGSQLINYLQLREQIETANHPETTKSLAQRAVEDYAARLKGKDFTPLTKSPARRRDLRYAFGAAGAAVVLLGVLFPISAPEFLRFLDPYGDHPAYSFTQVSIFAPADGELITYNGKAIIKAKTNGHTPDDLFVSFYDPARPSVVSTLPMYGKGDGEFYQAIEHIKSNLVIYAHTKNQYSVSKSERLNIILTPKIEHAFVEIAPPAYTGIKPQEMPCDFKSVSALAGSKVKFRIQSNRPLSQGVISLAGTSATVAMTPSGDSEVSGTFTAVDSARLEFAVTDVAGNRSQENSNVAFTVTQDLPPEVSIDVPGQDGYVCDDFKLESRISASDDYGLKEIRIHRALNDVYSAPKVISFNEIVRNDAEKVVFDIKSLGVQAGDMISMFVEAIDNCPEPHLARSKTLHLMVISTDEYNNYLRKQADISDIEGKYTSLLNEFHDLVDQQKELSKQADDLKKEMTDPATAKQAAEELDKLLAKQAELNQKLSQLADKMEHFVRQKPLYDLESDLQHSLTEKAKEIRDSVTQNNEALKKSLQQRAEGAQNQQGQNQLESLQCLLDQSKRQADALEPAQKKAEEQTLKPLQDAELMNQLVRDFNAMKYLYDLQTSAAGNAKAYEGKNATSDEDKLALRQMGDTERQMQKALSKTAENLRRHAEAAEKLFPKASKSARDLADAMENQRLSPIAGDAANAMSSGNGPDSSALAERLREEMRSLFTQTEGAGGACKGEMDQYLRLQYRLQAGNTYQQMSQCRKFGFGFGRGNGSGSGEGEEADGYSMQSSDFQLFGNETIGGNPKDGGKGGSGREGTAAAGDKVDIDKTDTVSGVKAINRQSSDTNSEAPIDEYKDVIDAYFNSITK